MSLFDVSGWNTPSKVATSDAVISRKRKRAAVAEEDAKVQTATVNIEKLMKKLDTGGIRPQKKEKKKEEGGKSQEGIAAVKAGKNLPQSKPSMTSSPVKESKKQHKRKHKDANGTGEQSTTVTVKNQGNAPSMKHEATNGLTALQSSMKSSLEGARFRHINELLYKSTSKDASQLVQKDPTMIEDYHAGFRYQTKSWPVNPVNQYISEIAAMNQPIVVADLGCGDAALAKELVPKGICVLSYDLKTDGQYIIEADICSKLPLPGSETDGGQVVDVVVCALSLMSTNWVQCIKETWRVLKLGGKLKIAEVTSRFEDVDEFVNLVVGVGYRLAAKDASNTHFIKFEFVKTTRKGATLDWKALGEKGKLLKPCEYKRR